MREVPKLVAPGLNRLLSAPVALALACFVYGVAVSWHWPIVHDASIMHYVVFLMDHGMAPYRDIIDINMPGAYMTEWLAVHLLGPGDVAWRLFDLLEMLAAIAACWVIALPVDPRAGLLAGLLLDIAHMADGAIQLGQRDWTVAVLLLAGYAFLLHAVRRARPPWMAAFAFACCAAAGIKPLAAPIPFILLAIACLTLRRRRQPLAPFLAWSAVGAVAAAAIFFGFLFAYHATADFFSMLHGLLAFYTGIGNISYTLMAKLVLGRYMTALLAATLVLASVLRMWRYPEVQILLTGLLFGAALYFGQHKGYNQHRLTLLAFVLLWICLLSFAALQRGGRTAAAGGLLLCLLLGYSGWHEVPSLRANTFDLHMQEALEGDLRRLGGASLSGRVQCVEMAAGCITDLYRMRLLQPTGFISDFFVFNQEPQPALDALRTRLLGELAARPPQVVVLVPSDWAGGPVEYQPTDNWRQFAAWLSSRYQLSAERRAPDGSIDRGSYRIYALRPAPHP